MHRWKKRLAAAVLTEGILLAGLGCARRNVYQAGMTVDAGEAADAAYSVSGEATDTAYAASGEATDTAYSVSGEAEGAEEKQAPNDSESYVGAAETEEQKLCVYVCGAVQQPDVYELPVGSRIYEAIQAAGGFTEAADTEWLNQAEFAVDGQKLRVFTKEETAQMELTGAKDMAGAMGSGGVLPGAEKSSKVNLNTATREELMTLPGIGETKADAILQYRMEHGGFAAIEEIQQISGIKTAVFSKIKDKITVDRT